MKKIYLKLKNKWSIWGLLCLLLFNLHLQAQQSTTTSLFNLNRLSFNPAYAGTSEKIPITFHMRQQWIGFTDAPRTQYLSTHAYLPMQIGIGGEVFNNVTGPTRQSGIKLALAKHFNLTKDSYISFGVSAELYQNFFDVSMLETSIPNDPTLTDNIKQTLAPDASLGCMYYANNYFAGLSVTNLIQSNYDIFDTSTDFNNPINRTFYLTGGYVLEINRQLKYKPSVLVKKTIALPYQADICNTFTYNNLFLAGFTFRTNLDLIFMAGIRYSFIEIYYAYDLSLNEMKSYNSGSQEIVLRANINNFYRNEKKYGKSQNERMFDW
jgi:type IX secretion system PorP/SprF family membrane protein